jgi:hypothetical protein
MNRAAARREQRSEPMPIRPQRPEAIVSDINMLLEQLIEIGRQKRGSPIMSEAARWAYRTGQIRRTVFGDRIVSDQAWDILLDLFIARSEQRQVSVTSACLAAAAPLTTVIRYIGHLEEVGLLKRSRNPRDARSSHLEITDEGARKIRTYLTEVLKAADSVYG